MSAFFGYGFAECVRGGVLSLAVGDALGVPGEFMSRDELARDPITDMRGGGAHGQEPGTWSDDTSMALCLMDSLAERGVDYDDQMRRYADWLTEAKYTARDEVFDVGGTTRRAIFNYLDGVPACNCGDDSERSCGNGSLMRILPLALYLWAEGRGELSPDSAGMIHDSSRCTHAHPMCLMACGMFCSVVWELLRGEDEDLKGLVRKGVRKALDYYRGDREFERVFEAFTSLMEIDKWEIGQVRGNGYVLHTLQAALWSLTTTESYGECVCRAVNLGEDMDTTAAVAGGLAGLYYRAEGIPAVWLEALARADVITALCDKFSAPFAGKD